jgi:hypothetical protein
LADDEGNGFKDEAEVITKAAPAYTPFEEIGVSGLRVYGGILQEEFLKDLQGDRARKVYREMTDNDSIIGAMLFSIDMLLRQVEFRVEPADEDTSGEWSDFCEQNMNDMSMTWDDTLSSILSMLPFGWSYHEIVYKQRNGPTADEGGSDTASPQDENPASSEYSDGLIGWRKLAIRAQDTLFKWEMDEKGGLQGMVQMAPPNFAPTLIPIQKALLFRTTAQKANPEGRSVLRNAYRSWYFKRRIEEIEGIGIERDLAGLPVLQAPARLFDPNASPTDKQALTGLETIVRNIRRDEQEGIVMPQAYDSNNNKMYGLELLTTGGRRQFDTDSIVARYDQRMAMTVMEDFILLGHEKVGSFQLGTSKVELFATALAAWLDSICAVFNSYAFPRLLRLNGVDEKLSPHLEHAEVERADLKELGGYILQMSQAGMPLFPDPVLEDHLRSIAGLPEQEGPEEEGSEPPPTQAQPLPPEQAQQAVSPGAP